MLSYQVTSKHIVLYSKRRIVASVLVFSLLTAGITDLFFFVVSNSSDLHAATRGEWLNYLSVLLISFVSFSLAGTFTYKKRDFLAETFWPSLAILTVGLGTFFLVYLPIGALIQRTSYF
jgi:hypothetical protein